PRRAASRAAAALADAVTIGNRAAPPHMSRILGNWVSCGDCRKFPALSAKIHRFTAILFGRSGVRLVLQGDNLAAHFRRRTGSASRLAGLGVSAWIPRIAREQWAGFAAHFFWILWQQNYLL